MKIKKNTVKKNVFITFWVVWLLITGIVVGAKMMPHVYPPDCVGCGDCVRVCPRPGRAISIIRGKAVINPEECIKCNKCIDICSYGAVR